MPASGDISDHVPVGIPCFQDCSPAAKMPCTCPRGLRLSTGGGRPPGVHTQAQGPPPTLCRNTGDQSLQQCPDWVAAVLGTMLAFSQQRCLLAKAK